MMVDHQLSPVFYHHKTVSNQILASPAMKQTAVDGPIPPERATDASDRPLGIASPIYQRLCGPIYTHCAKHHPSLRASSWKRSPIASLSSDNMCHAGRVIHTRNEPCCGRFPMRCRAVIDEEMTSTVYDHVLVVGVYSGSRRSDIIRTRDVNLLKTPATQRVQRTTGSRLISKIGVNRDCSPIVVKHCVLDWQ